MLTKSFFRKTLKRLFPAVLATAMLLVCVPRAEAATANYADTSYATRYDCSSGTCVPSRVNIPSTGTSANGVNYTPVSASSQEQELLRLMNAERAKAGLRPLVLEAALSGVARAKAQDMLQYRYFSHGSPRLGYVKDMLKAAGVSFRCANENIARYGSLSKAFAGLMSSVGHRNNILSKTYTHVGLCVQSDGNGALYLVQTFICK
jgi:uncharacterized protein YkwD